MSLRENDRRVQYRRSLDGGVFNIDPSSEQGRDWIRNNPTATELPRTERQSTLGIERPEVEAGGDINAMNVNQLKRYAAEHDIDLEGATLKADILAKVAAAAPQEPAQSGEDED